MSDYDAVGADWMTACGADGYLFVALASDLRAVSVTDCSFDGTSWGAQAVVDAVSGDLDVV